MSALRLFFVISLLWCIFAQPLPVHAAPPHSTAIIVGDDIITHHDVEQRLNVALVTSGLAQTEENRRLLLPQIVQLLIDEALYRQEAKVLDIAISEQEIASALASIEQKNGLPQNSFDMFLQENNLSRESFVDQLEAQLAWKKIITRKIRPFLSVSAREVQEELEHIQSHKLQEEVYISEITLPIEDEKDHSKIQSLANQLYTELQRGVSFLKVAKQFSRSSSADNGGEIGWIASRQLAKPLRNALLTLKVGDVSAPIRTENSYTLLRLHKRRFIDISEQKNYEDSIVELKQLFIPISEFTSPANINAYLHNMQHVRTSENITCNTIDDIARTIQGGKLTKGITTSVSTLHPEIRQEVAKLDNNRPTDVIRTSLGLHIFIVCDRTFPQAPQPEANKHIVKQKLLQKKLILNTRKYLRDLRRKTFIEVRL